MTRSSTQSVPDATPSGGAEPPSPKVGDVVAGKYELVRPIGLGAMGLVFEAVHRKLMQHVAIKFMQPRLVGQADAVARFEREGRAASRLTSPHATRIFDVDTTGEGVPYIVSELLEGNDLRKELADRGPLPVAEAVGYMVQACAVMAEAHALGIVHRDLKPSNLFLASTGAGRTVKLLDFGISKMEEELELTTTGIMLGSPRYMSPEQVEAKRVDRRADIWALGVMLYRSLSGTYPFEGDTSISLALAILTRRPRDLSSLRPEIPKELAAAVEKALTVDRAGRHQTARDFAEAIAPFGPPEALALAGSLTHDVPPAESSKPFVLPTPQAQTLTAGAKAVDDLIQVAIDAPLEPESASAQPATLEIHAASRVGAARRVAWALAAVVALSLAGLALARLVATPATSAATFAPSAEAPARVSPLPEEVTPRPADSGEVEAPPRSPPSIQPEAPSAEPAPRVQGPTPTPRASSARPPKLPAPPHAAPKNPTYL